MRKLTILFTFFTLHSFATTYYVSNAGNTTNAGTSPITAWTLPKLNMSWGIIQPGDQILFNRGETFVGTIAITKSGTATKPIYIGAYGESLNKPIITGLADVTVWTNVGGNIWKSADADLSGLSSLKVVLINNQLQRMGRYPNYNPTTEGYNIIDAVTLGAGTSTSPDVITDAALPASPNWTGATLVAKTSSISTDNLPIYSHSGSTISTGRASNGYTVKPRFGYFIQNSLLALDTLNEWYFKASTHEMYVYSLTAPTNVQVAKYNNLLTAANVSFVTVDGLTFYGSNDNSINYSSGIRLQLLNTDIYYAGNIAINMVNSNNSTIDNCNVEYSLVGAVRVGNGIRDTVINSYFHWNELIDGLGGQGPGGSSVSLNGKHSLIQYNTFDSTSFMAIKYGDDSVKVYNNFINHYCMLKTDGGAIYNEGESDGKGGPVTHSGVEIVGNIILNGIGTLNGVPDINRNVHGIYCDGFANHQLIKGNVVINTPRSSLYLNNNQYMTVIDNIFYNNKLHNVFVRYDGNSAVKGIVMKRNVFFGREKTGKLLQLHTITSTPDFNTFFTSLDSNYYCRPINEPTNISTSAGGVMASEINTTGSYYSLDKWQTAFLNFDKASQKTVKPISDTSEIRVEYNASKSVVTKSLNGKTYVNYKGVPYTKGTITLQPYTGEILLVTPSVPIDAGTNQLPNVAISSPANNAIFSQPTNVSFTATSSDNDGTISKVEFYSGGTLLGTDNSSPYNFVWNSIPSGEISVTAVAYDNSGGVSNSAPINITVNRQNVPPSVSLTSPLNGDQFISPGKINMAANATDNDGYITKVEFYNGNTLLWTTTTTPYAFTWNNVQPGSYTITAKATDDKGAVTTSVSANISVREIVAPNVILTSPTNNASYIAPASINISATASDPDGVVTKVEFYNNNVLVYTDAAAPYSYNLSGLSSGNYNIIAKAYDNDGLSSTSSAVAIVSSKVKNPPVISITTDSTTYVDPALININSNATDADGTIARVDFYSNGNYIGSDYSQPFNLSYSSVMAGTYSITAKAIDNDSISTTSAPVNITVTHINVPPTIQIISPASGDSASEDVGLTMNVIANDDDGKITKVEFYNGTTLLGTSTNSPYSLQVFLPEGTYTLTAKATDNSGATAQKTITFKIYVIPNRPIQIKGFKAIIK